jgi:hypothetical protein
MDTVTHDLYAVISSGDAAVSCTLARGELAAHQYAARLVIQALDELLREEGGDDEQELRDILANAGTVDELRSALWDYFETDDDWRIDICPVEPAIVTASASVEG